MKEIVSYSVTSNSYAFSGIAGTVWVLYTGLINHLTELLRDPFYQEEVGSLQPHNYMRYKWI